MARPNGSKGFVVEETEAEASSRRKATSNSQSNNYNEVLEQHLPALVAMQQIQ